MTEAVSVAEDSTDAALSAVSEEELARIDAWWRAANYLMVVRNDLDRFHLVADVLDRVPGIPEAKARDLRAMLEKSLAEHRRYIETYGEDVPEILGWRWGRRSDGRRGSDTAADF